jgi:hypothetical protein
VPSCGPFDWPGMTERALSRPGHHVNHTNGRHAGLAGTGLRRAMSQQYDHILQSARLGAALPAAATAEACWEAAMTEARELLAAREPKAAAAVAGAVLRDSAAATQATVLECRNIMGCALWLCGEGREAASALEAAMAGGRSRPLLLNHALVAAHHDPAAAAESLGRYALETADPGRRIAAVQRGLALWSQSRGTAGPGPASALPRTLFAALRTVAITTSRAQLAPLGLAGAFGELMAYLHGRHLGAEPALGAVLVDAPSACTWVLLGLDYGTAVPEARRAFARQARRLREAGHNGALADLTGALHEVEHGPPPGARLDQYRIPLSISEEQR